MFEFIIKNDKNIYKARKRRFDNLYQVTWSNFELFYSVEDVDSYVKNSIWKQVKKEDTNLEIEEFQKIQQTIFNSINFNLSMIADYKEIQKENPEVNCRCDIENYESKNEELKKMIDRIEIIKVSNLKAIAVEDEFVMIVSENKIMAWISQNDIQEYDFFIRNNYILNDELLMKSDFDYMLNILKNTYDMHLKTYRKEISGVKGSNHLFGLVVRKRLLEPTGITISKFERLGVNI